jgi:alkaline phosphatase
MTTMFTHTEQPSKSEYWQDQNREHLHDKRKRQLHTKPARNVILFLGDGMGVTVNTAARIYTGQVEKLYSDQAPLAWELFDHAGFVAHFQSLSYSYIPSEIL